MFRLLFTFKKLLIVPVLMLFVLPAQLLAHPHSWIDTTTYINSNNTHITSLSMSWTFDQATSDYMLQGEDISAAALKNTLQHLAEGIVANMYNEHYFTYLYVQATPIRYKIAHSPKLVYNQDRNKLILTFEIPLSVPIAFNDKNFKLLIYDATYYVDMSWKNTADVHLSTAMQKTCHGELIEPNVSQGLRDYAFTLADDVLADDQLGERFSQKFTLSCQ